MGMNCDAAWDNYSAYKALGWKLQRKQITRVEFVIQWYALQDRARKFREMQIENQKEVENVEQ